METTRSAAPTAVGERNRAHLDEQLADALRTRSGPPSNSAARKRAGGAASPVRIAQDARRGSIHQRPPHSGCNLHTRLGQTSIHEAPRQPRVARST